MDSKNLTWTTWTLIISKELGHHKSQTWTGIAKPECPHPVGLTLYDLTHFYNLDSVFFYSCKFQQHRWIRIRVQDLLHLLEKKQLYRGLGSSRCNLASKHYVNQMWGCNLTTRIPKDLIKSEWENTINALYAISKPQDHLVTKTHVGSCLQLVLLFHCVSFGS